MMMSRNSSSSSRRVTSVDKENDPTARSDVRRGLTGTGSLSKPAGVTTRQAYLAATVSSSAAAATTVNGKRRRVIAPPVPALPPPEQPLIPLGEPLPTIAEEIFSSPHSLLKSKHDESFDAQFGGEVQAALEFKYLTPKHNFGAHMKEMGAHIKALRECVLGYKMRKDTLLRHTATLESKWVADMQQLSKGREEVDQQLAGVQAALTQEQHSRAKLEMEKDMRVQHLTTQLQHSEEGFKAQIAELKAELKAAQAVRVELEVGVRQAEVEAQGLKAELARTHEVVNQKSTHIETLTLEVRELNGKLAVKGEELSSALASFNRNQAFHQERIEALESEKRELLARLENERKEAIERLDRERDDFRARLEALNIEKAKVESDRENLTARVTETKAQVEAGEREVFTLTKELEAIKTMSNYSKQEQLASLCKLSVEADCLRRQLEGKDDLADMLAHAKQGMKDLEQKLFQSESVRRTLHNKIQELKGNVRVMARVRPCMPGMMDPAGSFPVIDCAPDGKQLKINVEGKEHPFSFDQVFSPNSKQIDVFQEVSQLVQSALDGHDVCLFSYGQTGSGKTHTMQGSGGPQSEERGIIPRAIHKVMEEATRLEGSGWAFTLEATFCEIYLENVYDLLTGSGPNNRKALEIKMEDQTRTHVPGLSRVTIKTEEQIEHLLITANKARSVASTQMNERSSRSHSVFTLHCTGVYASESLVVRGTLNLCDLAGSERISKSLVEGDDLAVTQSINKSLSALGLVFTSLSNKGTHIPFRNSKLTYLLQHCFQQGGKTLMLVNLGPCSVHAPESLCSLRFAQNVNNTVLGRPGTGPTKRVERLVTTAGEADDAHVEHNTVGARVPSTTSAAPNSKAMTANINRLAMPKRK